MLQTFPPHPQHTLVDGPEYLELPLPQAVGEAGVLTGWADKLRCLSTK